MYVYFFLITLWLKINGRAPNIKHGYTDRSQIKFLDKFSSYPLRLQDTVTVAIYNIHKWPFNST